GGCAEAGGRGGHAGAAAHRRAGRAGPLVRRLAGPAPARRRRRLRAARGIPAPQRHRGLRGDGDAARRPEPDRHGRRYRRDRPPGDPHARRPGPGQRGRCRPPTGHDPPGSRMSWALPLVTCQHVVMADDTELAEGEHTVLLLHPHWKILLRPTLILLIVAAAAAVVLLMIPPGSYATTGRIAVGVLAVVVAVTWFGVPFLRWQTTTYELTTRRLRLREGILSRSGRDFPLIRISD